METTTEQRLDVYALVNNRIIEQLELGKIPWQQPWTAAGLPQNLISKKPYRGINVWLLASLTYSQNYFLTFKQLKELGGMVKKGEKGCPVVFWQIDEVLDEKKEQMKKRSLLRYYSVFNVSQCEGIPENKIPKAVEYENNSVTECERIIEEMPKCPRIKYGEHQAYYHPLHDYVNMPPIGSFRNSDSFYSVLFHELVHSTGHMSRLNRKGITEISSFGSLNYSFEELIAELGACYLNSLTGISPKIFRNNAAYIQGWLRKFKDDKRFLISAAAHSQKAVDFILNIKLHENTEETFSTNASHGN